MTPLLAGVRVLDLTRFLAGPFASMLLGDMGAEVIKIETPGGGDPMRGMPPYFLEGQSAYFLSINRNKRSMTLDVKAPAGREVFYDLVRVSDVVVENYRPGVAERLGLDYQTLREINPRIIACSISGFGLVGPHRDRPAFDLVLQAMSGAMSITGEPGRTPVRMGIPMGDLAGAMYAAQAVSAALYARARSGEGACIDLSLLDCLTSLLTYVAQYYLAGSPVPEPVGSHHQSVVPYGVFATADGYLVIAIFAEKFWGALCRALKEPELEADSRFMDQQARLEHRDEIMPLLEGIFRGRTTEEWLDRLEAEGVPCGPVNTVDKVLADPQIVAREMLVHVDHPLIQGLSMLGSPVKVAGVSAEYLPPPLLGQHTEMILREVLKYSDEQISSLQEAGLL